MDLLHSLRMQIMELYRGGQLTYRDIANQLNVGLGSVSRIIGVWILTGDIQEMQSRRIGRPPTNRAFGERTFRLLLRESVIDSRATARQLRDRVRGEAMKASVHTIQGYLRRGGRFPYHPRPGPVLKKKNKRTRLEWAQKHKKWTIQQWSKVPDLGHI